ncbi:MAG: DUF2851 family protein [Bacteroidetes bacterium]|nr:DUF2851 family protein [Bacteroidota bacterium]
MGHNQKVYESQLYEIWQNRNYIADLTTVSGVDISVLDPGVQDLSESGPDFKNARVRIGNLTYVGDIEIDCDYRDWKLHGHNIDLKYNKVILHACLNNKFKQPYVYTKDGRKVPTICIKDFIEEGRLQNFKSELTYESHGNNLKCSIGVADVNFEVKENLLTTLGVERFNKKCERIHKRLKELVYVNDLSLKEPVLAYDLPSEFEEKIFEDKSFNDKEIWEQAFYELLFEALGYSKNKNIMLSLAQSANISLIKKVLNEGHGNEFIEPLLFGVSGILPKNIANNGDRMPAYAAQILSRWNYIRTIYDGKTYEETEWHFFKLRPQNFPTIRLAAGSRLLIEIVERDLIAKIVKKIEEIRNLTVLINSIRSLFVIKSDGFWSQHYVFDKPAGVDVKYFVGATRADEIVVNVILPFFAVYFEIFGEEKLSRKIYKLYSMYNQKSDNKIVRDVANNLCMTNQLKRTVLSQGMIELFRSYCSKNRCLDCPIGKIIFN